MKKIKVLFLYSDTSEFYIIEVNENYKNMYDELEALKIKKLLCENGLYEIALNYSDNINDKDLISIDYLKSLHIEYVSCADEEHLLKIKF